MALSLRFDIAMALSLRFDIAMALSLRFDLAAVHFHSKEEIMYQAVVERNAERTVLMVLKGQN
jgi:hypothetical protein